MQPSSSFATRNRPRYSATLLSRARQQAVALVLVIFMSSCTHTSNQSPEQYKGSIRAWQKQRDAGLRSADSWLTLAGLFWLTPGGQTIGAADTNDLVLPKKSAPAVIGRLELQGDKVIFTNVAGSAVTVNNKPANSPCALGYDENKPDIVRAGSISFYIIKRLTKVGVRAKDTNSPVLKSFQGMQYFPINAELHFANARLISNPKRIPIVNILGQTDMEDSPGILEFTYRGQRYHLRPIYEGKTLFFLFKDPTNKTQTYQAGRMLNTPLPEHGRVDLDFNRSYNPPCTFTPYATCPLPPRENTLPFPVTAGELRYRVGNAE